MQKKWLDSIFSDGSKLFVSNPYPKRGEEIIIKLRLRDDAPVDYAFLKTEYNGVERISEMSKDYSENGLLYYSIKVTPLEPVFRYIFYIASEGMIYYYNQSGITDYIPDDSFDFRIATDYENSEWVKNAVFYQIFPDRFCNGNPENDVKTNEFECDGYMAKKISNWNEPPKEYEFAHCLDFYGGDLNGVIEKIPYLKKLGITAIYLNPIFYAASVHKYDCLDYFHVDPHFGGDEALEELTKKLHDNGMKLMLDVSINHTGTNNKWFNKDGRFYDKSIGAYNNKSVKERNFYFFNEKNEYKCWADVPTLPTLNYTSEDVRDIVYKSDNSVVKKWLKAPFNIDAWRFDVADTLARNNEIQLQHEVWPGIRKSIKEENKEAYVIGENWCDSSDFLKGNEWDSAMNYFGFMRPVREFAGEQDMHNGRNPKLWTKYRMTARNLKNRIIQHLGKIPYQLQEVQYNLLDSHDCSRLHNVPSVSFDDYRGAIIMLFTMIGATSVYYGDEATIDGHLPSMEGCRYPMPWDKDIEGSRNYPLYHKLALLKQNEECFKGSLKFISDDDYVLTYARFTHDEVMISIISADDLERVVRIDGSIFGKKPTINKVDLLGTSIDASIEDDELLVKVKPHTSYVFKL